MLFNFERKHVLDLDGPAVIAPKLRPKTWAEWDLYVRGTQLSLSCAPMYCMTERQLAELGPHPEEPQRYSEGNLLALLPGVGAMYQPIESQDHSLLSGRSVRLRAEMGEAGVSLYIPLWRWE